MPASEPKLLDFRTVVECRCCRSRRFDAFLSLGDLPIGDQFATTSGSTRSVCAQELMLCRDCGFVFLGRVVDPSILYMDHTYLYQTSISPGLERHFQAAARHLARVTGIGPDDPIVDIGCNDGTLLKAFQSTGFCRLSGYEPTPILAAKARETGIDIECGFFSKESVPRRQAKLVTANNVFANIEDLDGFMEGIQATLAPDGTFVVETGYCVDLVQNAVLDNLYHEHLSYFTVSSLNALLARHGMEIRHVERIHTKGGSIRCFMQRKGEGQPEDASVRGLIAQERELGYDTILPFLCLRDRLESTRRSVDRWMDSREGRKIAGFGASVGGVTMIEYFGLHRIIDTLYDDNPIKFGTFSPLRDIPVKPASDLAKDAPGILAILPWRYRRLVQDRHGSTLPASSKILSILPRPAFHLPDGTLEVLS